MAIEKKIDIIVDVSDAITDVNKLDTSMKALDKTTESLGKSQSDTKQKVLDNGGAMGLLNDATGGLAMTFKDAVEASSLFGKQSKIGIATQKAYSFVMGTSTGAMKAFKLALIGTGIGALVVGVGLLIANFDKVKKAVENLIPGFKAISEFIGGIIDSITDFIGVTSDLTRELDKMEAQATKTLEKNKLFLDAYGDQYDEFTKRKIEANNAYAEHVKEINANEELSEEEKLKRLKLLRDRADREIAQADADRETKRNEARQKEIDEANAKAKADADKRQAERDRLQKESFDFAVKMADLERSIQEEKRLRDQQIAEEDYQAMVEQTERELALLKKKSDEEKKAAEEQKIRDEAVAQNRVNVTEQTFNLIAQLAGEASAVAKGIAVAQATIDTYKGAVSAYSAMSGIPIVGPALGAVAAGAVIAAGVMNVKKILATKPVESGTPSASSGGGAQAPSAPSFNLVGGTGINQIAQGLGQQQQPLQAYVVSGNVTSAQEMDRNIVDTASVG